jgi:hypothetical protein
MIKDSKALSARVLLAAAPLAVVLMAPVQASAEELPMLSGSVSSAVIVGGDSGVETITLSTPAPAEGVDVNLRDQNGGGVLYGDGRPGWNTTVKVPAGATTVRVPFHVVAPEVEKTVKLQATLKDSLEPWVDIATLKILPANPADRAVQSLSLSQGSVHEGTTVTGTVKLAKPAPVDGITVNLENLIPGQGPTEPTLEYPAFVTVPNGSTTATFPLKVDQVPYAKILPVTASLGTTKASSDLVVVHSNRLTLSYEGGDPGTTTKGAVGIGTTWNPLGATIKLTTDNPGITVPATVKIPGGIPGVTFPITVSPNAAHNSTVTITATWLNQTVTSTFYVR